MPPKRTVASPVRVPAESVRSASRSAAQQQVDSTVETVEGTELRAERSHAQGNLASRALTNQAVSNQPSSLCAICLTASADFLCSPCGHQCACETCLRQVQASGGSKCPICRHRFTSIQRVYVAGSGTLDSTALRLAEQSGSMAGSGIQLMSEQTEWQQHGRQGEQMLRQRLLSDTVSRSNAQRNSVCCCAGLVALLWVVAAVLVYGTDQPCAVARGWKGGLASKLQGCNETWGGTCLNHTYINYKDDPLFYGCKPRQCDPETFNRCPAGPHHVPVPCPASGPNRGLCPGASDPSTSCAAFERCQTETTQHKATNICPRACPRGRTGEWCVRAGYGKWISTMSNCTEPSLAVCEGDGGRFGDSGSLGCEFRSTC